jgi:hypothetical protein
MKPVRYAIIQKTLDIPNVEALRRAFTAVRCLVDSDAHALANDAYGILVKNLSLDDAMTLERALRAENIDTEAVPQAALPQLPATKFVRRVEFGRGALLVFDPVGRSFPIEWPHLMLIAAGNVLGTRPARRSALPRPTRSLLGSSRWTRWTRTDTFSSRTRTEPQEAPTGVLTLELLLTRGVARYTLIADDSAPLLFRCLGERQTDDRTRNFQLLVDEFGRAAPHAWCNRGAWLLRQTPPSLLEYPSPNAFSEEILWMLWRHAR